MHAAWPGLLVAELLLLHCCCCPPAGILGKFSTSWREAGNQPVQVLTKYVPNIFNSRPTPASVEAAVRRSLDNLQVGGGCGSSSRTAAERRAPLHTA
jgi:hypothetical protein